MKNEYIPGVCNIGPQERLFRRRSGYLGLVLTALYLIIIITFKLTFPFKLIVFIPIFVSAISFLQDRMHFCAEFGVLGRYNFSDKVGNTLIVEQKEYLRLDRVKALKIILYSLTISLIITLLFVIIL